MSNPVGSHHNLFNHAAGLKRQPAAPRHPPASEIVAAGFLRLIHEQTVILLKAITPAARANNRYTIVQRKCIPITQGTPKLRFLAVKSTKTVLTFRQGGGTFVVKEFSRESRER